MPCSLSCVAVQPITHVARALTPPPPPPFAPYRSPPFPQMTRRLNFSTGTEVQRDILRLLSERYEIDASGAAVLMQAVFRRKIAAKRAAEVVAVAAGAAVE